MTTSWKDGPSSAAKSIFIMRVERALYGSLKKQLQTREMELIIENAQLHGNHQLCMWFGGELRGLNNYMAGHAPRPANQMKPQIADRFKALMLLREEMEDELVYIRNYTRRAMSTLKCFEDYLKAFPEALHSHLTEIKNTLYWWKPEPLSPEAMEEFLKTNEKYITMMKVRMVKNLINI